MKKILLATTLLAASTGFAAAEVALSGSARMGITNDTGAGDLSGDAMFTSRVRIVGTMTGTTDGGLEFGASMRFDQNGGNADGLANDDSTVYISGAFGKLTFGDNDSAANATVGNVSGVGLTGLGDKNELGYLGQTDTSALYQYSTGALSFALSAGQTSVAEDAMSAAVKYSTDQFSVALGYEDTAADTQLSLGASATFGAATVKVVAADRDTNLSTEYAVSVDFTAGAAVITAFYSSQSAATAAAEYTAMGLGASYDLGGGAKVVGGVADNGTDTVADLGLSFSF